VKSPTLTLSCLLLFSIFLGCSSDESGDVSEPLASEENSPEVSMKVVESREGFTISGPNGLSIECKTSPRNMSAPSFGDLPHQVEIMAGWIDLDGATEGEEARKFGLGTIFIRFDESAPGTYPLAHGDAEKGVKIRIDSIEELDLSHDAVSVSGELQFEQLKVASNGRPETAVGNFSGEFAMGNKGETISLSGEFAIGIKE
jgi:hypothetical protein